MTFPLMPFVVWKTRLTPTLSFITAAANGTNGTGSRTWSGVSLGTQTSGEGVIVGIYTRNVTPTGVTVAGIAATQLGSSSANGADVLSFWWVPNLASTSGDVVIFFSGTADRTGYAIYRATINSTTPYQYYSGTSVTLTDPGVEHISLVMDFDNDGSLGADLNSDFGAFDFEIDSNTSDWFAGVGAANSNPSNHSTPDKMIAITLT